MQGSEPTKSDMKVAIGTPEGSQARLNMTPRSQPSDIFLRCAVV